MPKADISAPPAASERMLTADKRKSWKSGLLTWIVSLAFYGFIIVIVAAAYLLTMQGDKLRVIYGYSMFIVQSGSMQPEIPTGSLILVKSVDPGVIGIGDDITYVRPDYNVITHKVTYIYENYRNSGMRGFQTQGIVNPEPDRDIVYGDNVVGRVVFHNVDLGIFLSWLRGRVWFAVAYIVVFALLLYVLRYLARLKYKSPKQAGQTPVWLYHWGHKNEAGDSIEDRLLDDIKIVDNQSNNI